MPAIAVVKFADDQRNHQRTASLPILPRRADRNRYRKVDLIAPLIGIRWHTARL